MTNEEREALGRVVRETWIAWAREQPTPKPSWLVPWEGLNEPDREVDRRIGEAVRARVIADLAATAPPMRGMSAEREAEIRREMEIDGHTIMLDEIDALRAALAAAQDQARTVRCPECGGPHPAAECDAEEGF